MKTIFEKPQAASSETQKPHVDHSQTKEGHATTPEIQTKTDAEGKDVGLFTALCEYPKNIDFVNQEEGEKIILFLRRHFITNLTWIVPSATALFIPPLLFITSAIFEINLMPVPAGLLVVLVTFYYLIIIGYAFTSFLSWFYNIGIVTEKRLVDIDYLNILSKNIAATHFSEVVDLEYTQKGIFQSFFNYGDIMLQTQGIKPNFEFLASPKPVHVSNIIHGIIAKERGVEK